MRELRARSSGLCQPHYVLDIRVAMPRRCSISATSEQAAIPTGCAMPKADGISYPNPEKPDDVM